MLAAIGVVAQGATIMCSAVSIPSMKSASRSKLTEIATEQLGQLALGAGHEAARDRRAPDRSHFPTGSSPAR